MKQLSFAIAAALIAIASPAAAQLSSDPRFDFIDAVKKSDGDKVEQLLHSHSPASLVNSTDSDGNTALIIAVNRRDEDWTGFLLNQGADPNLPGSGGDTPLIVASRIGFEQAAEWLIGLGAKVDATNKMGETALITAVVQRQVPLVKLLLAAGADPDKQDTAAGFSARDYAQRDPRARDILQLINAKRPKPSAGH